MNYRTGSSVSRTRVMDRRTFAPGAYVFKEGAPGDCAYLVQSGTVEICRTIDGREAVLGTIPPGGIFGEMALLDDLPRMASARAAEPTTVVVVSREMLKAKLEKTDPVLRGILHIFAGRIRDMVARGDSDRKKGLDDKRGGLPKAGAAPLS